MPFYRCHSLVPPDQEGPGQVRSSDLVLRRRVGLRPPRLHRPRLPREAKVLRRHRLQLQAVSYTSMRLIPIRALLSVSCQMARLGFFSYHRDRELNSRQQSCTSSRDLLRTLYRLSYSAAAGLMKLLLFRSLKICSTGTEIHSSSDSPIEAVR